MEYLTFFSTKKTKYGNVSYIGRVRVKLNGKRLCDHSAGYPRKTKREAARDAVKLMKQLAS